MQEPQNRSTSESVTALSFTNLLGLFFSGILSLVRKAILFVFRFKVLLSLAAIAGIVAGISMYLIVPLSYRLTMIVKPTELNGKIFGQMLKSLNNLASSGSYDVLARNFNISQDASKKIISISGQTMQGIDLLKDTTQNYDKPFIIELYVKDNSISTTMEGVIISYFNNNRYLNKLKNDKTLLSINKIEYLNSELGKLDTLKNAYNSFLTMSKTPSMYYNNAMDPVGTYETSSNFYNERNALKEWLLQNKEVLVQVDGFKPSKVPNSKGVASFIFVYGAVFFLTGCLIILLFQVIRDSLRHNPAV